MTTTENELVRIRLGELLTEAQQIEKSMQELWSANAPVTPARIAAIASKFDLLARDVRELAEYPTEATRALRLHGIPEAIGVLYPLTHRPGEYMGISRACPECGGTVPARGTPTGYGWNEDCQTCCAAAKGSTS